MSFLAVNFESLVSSTSIPPTNKRSARLNGAPLEQYWSQDTQALIDQLKSSNVGLDSAEALRRFHDSAAISKTDSRNALVLLAKQFSSPIILLLLFAAGMSVYLGQHTDAAIIIAIIFISGFLGFIQEYGANDAVRKLLAIVEVKSTVLRDGKQLSIPVEEVVRGDVLVLTAGTKISADAVVLSSKYLFVDQSALTGESFPAEKQPQAVALSSSLMERTNCVYMGTHVLSGEGKAIVVHCGKQTEFGQVSEHIRKASSNGEFERGIRQFGYFLMEITMLLVVAIFAINVYFHRPVLESFMFALALAVGLTPQLLPAIVTVNLSSGAKRMAKKKLIVKQLSAIESLGAMNVLCSDKTGTLTEGAVSLQGALDVTGKSNSEVRKFACLNSALQTGFKNPIDEAIQKFWEPEFSVYRKIDEIPYDFFRKRLSVAVDAPGFSSPLLITKGALKEVLRACSKACNSRSIESTFPLELVEKDVHKVAEEYSAAGCRVLGLAVKPLRPNQLDVTTSDEQDMIFLGILVLHDPIKDDVASTLKELDRLGVQFKIITGDNRMAATAVAKSIGFSDAKLLLGEEIHQLTDLALAARVLDVDVFAEVEPNHKERIVIALKKAGNVVGYIGDGINDASALHAADVGVSVNNAVDVAKETAQFVMLEHDLAVLTGAIYEGRKTFANTMKYIFMATSANFGNMFSMAAASLFLAFLPLLPKQVLLTNLLTDFPELTISTDKVDEELVNRPCKWDLSFIQHFMLTFGALSSIFDLITFAVLLFILHADNNQFRSGWFLESVVSACVVVLIVRTRRLVIRSQPSWPLIITTGLTVIVTTTLAWCGAPLLGFAPLNGDYFIYLFGIVFLYAVSAELTKVLFYRKLAKSTKVRPCTTQ